MKMSNDVNTIKAGKMKTRKKAELIFYIGIVSLPTLHFLIFYMGVNINSILLAFKGYDYNAGSYTFIGMKNFSRMIESLTAIGSPLVTSIKNSIKIYFIGLVLTPTGLLFSYYIYKKMKFSEVFRVMLFLPSIISSIVLIIAFKYFTDIALPDMVESLLNIKMIGLFSDFSTIFPTVIFYGIWSGYGLSILMYTSSMSRIPEQLVESAKLDGITALKEFFYITMPLIYPTFSTFFVLGFSGIFINQAGLYSFFSDSADPSMYTIGYYLFTRVIGKQASISEYPYASALGIIFTFISAPLTLFVRWGMEKIGPTVEY